MPRIGNCENCMGEGIPTKYFEGGGVRHEYCEFCAGLPVSNNTRGDPAVMAVARLYRLLSTKVVKRRIPKVKRAAR